MVEALIIFLSPPTLTAVEVGISAEKSAIKLTVASILFPVSALSTSLSLVISPCMGSILPCAPFGIGGIFFISLAKAIIVTPSDAAYWMNFPPILLDAPNTITFLPLIFFSDLTIFNLLHYTIYPSAKMHKIFISIFPGNRKSYLRNNIFDPNKQDEWSPIFIELKEYLNKNGVDIQTCDLPEEKISYRFLSFDLPYPWRVWTFPAWKKIFSNKNSNILLCQEPPTVIPFNYMKVFHIFFSKVYTWNDDLVDNRKYFKMRLPRRSVGINTNAKGFKDKKFLTLINTNKSPFYPFVLLSSFGKELYSERIKAIDFFEKNIPDNFYLYGRGWNKPKKYNIKEKLFGFKKYKSYKGEVDDKIELLSNFKYSICFENLTNVNGYITEKIFDCFKAKCVPIYWGASNIEKYIPKDCYIDFRNFKDYNQLLTFLSSITEEQYSQYIKNIEKLLNDEKFTYSWFEEGYANFILKDVLEIQN